MSSDRRVRVLPTVPGLRHGVGSLIALGGTGRLRRLGRMLHAKDRVRADPYEYLAGLESTLETIRSGRTC